LALSCYLRTVRDDVHDLLPGWSAVTIISLVGVHDCRGGCGVGDRKRVSRKRAEGTREHIVAYLVQTGDLADPAGMASTRLATAVGYPGSSVAFAQLLSGMERSGIIERDVRGKRTYRIGLSRAHIAAPAEHGSAAPASGRPGPNGRAGANGRPGATADGAAGADGVAGANGAAGADGVAGAVAGAVADFDYDELARRLLAQVVRRLAGSELARSELARSDLAEAKLAEENVRLREQLRAAEESLTLARESLRRLSGPADLDSSELMLLQRLLGPDAGTAGYSAATPG
jgi:hypothetical protein